MIISSRTLSFATAVFLLFSSTYALQAENQASFAPVESKTTAQGEPIIPNVTEPEIKDVSTSQAPGLAAAVAEGQKEIENLAPVETPGKTTTEISAQEAASVPLPAAPVKSDDSAKVESGEDPITSVNQDISGNQSQTPDDSLPQTLGPDASGNQAPVPDAVINQSSRNESQGPAQVEPQIDDNLNGQVEQVSVPTPTVQDTAQTETTKINNPVEQVQSVENQTVRIKEEVKKVVEVETNTAQSNTLPPEEISDKKPLDSAVTPTQTKEETRVTESVDLVDEIEKEILTTKEPESVNTQEKLDNVSTNTQSANKANEALVEKQNEQNTPALPQDDSDHKVTPLDVATMMSENPAEAHETEEPATQTNHGSDQEAQSEPREGHNKSNEVEGQRSNASSGYLLDTEFLAAKNETDSVTDTLKEELAESYNSYVIDSESCGELRKSLPDQILRMTVARVLRTIISPNCTDSLADIRLRSARNKRIKGQVMEASSIPLDVLQLMTSVSARVKCNFKQVDEHLLPKIKFGLSFDLESSDHKMRGRWRRYQQIKVDEIPIAMFGRSQDDAEQMKVGAKCQRFKHDGGDYYLELKSIETRLDTEITLNKLNNSTYAATQELGGEILVTDYNFRRLKLNHKIDLNGATSRKQNNGFAVVAPTVSIMHDNNIQHRRNDWLLDLYGNWLRHEYKSQLSRLLSRLLAKRLNSCFQD